METAIKLLGLLGLLLITQTMFPQKTIKEYVTKTDAEKIKKNITIIGQPVMNSPKSFKDGRSKWPFFTSKKQLPDTIALITYNISDLGLATSWSNNYAVYTEYFSLTETGGNIVANEMLKQTIETMKEEFKKQGVVLLTINELVNKPEKRQYYYHDFVPTVSKVGYFLSDIENRATDISVCADYYRYFDMGATYDFLRSESLGYDLANNLGVDGVLSIGFVIQSNKQEVYLRAMKMAIHGPNPTQKEDKKYRGQKLGSGYYNGQMFIGGQLQFKKPFKTAEIKGKDITNMDFDGLEVIMKSFIEKFYEAIYYSIGKVTK